MHYEDYNKVPPLLPLFHSSFGAVNGRSFIVLGVALVFPLLLRSLHDWAQDNVVGDEGKDSTGSIIVEFAIEDHRALLRIVRIGDERDNSSQTIERWYLSFEHPISKIHGMVLRCGYQLVVEILEGHHSPIKHPREKGSAFNTFLDCRELASIGMVPNKAGEGNLCGSIARPAPGDVGLLRDIASEGLPTALRSLLFLFQPGRALTLPIGWRNGLGQIGQLDISVETPETTAAAITHPSVYLLGGGGTLNRLLSTL